jgi:Family of unknown function (DUF6338)
MPTQVAQAVAALLAEGIVGTILFLMPGHLLRVAYDHGVHRPEQPDKVFMANTVVAALVVHAIALPWTLRLVRVIQADGAGVHVWEITAWVLAALIVLPTAGGRVVAELARRERPVWLARFMRLIGLSHAVRNVEAWHWALGSGQSAYVRVRLKNDKVLLGYYGTRSFASSDAGCRDLYLETQFRPGDGKVFGPRMGASRGVWISGDDIAVIEFFGGAEPPVSTVLNTREPAADGYAARKETAA